MPNASEPGTPGSANEPSPRHRRGAGWLWLVVFIFVVYPLSTGPALKFGWRRGTSPPRVIEIIYYPLDFLCKHSTSLSYFFQWYIDGVWHWDPVPNQTPIPAARAAAPEPRFRPSPSLVPIRAIRVSPDPFPVPLAFCRTGPILRSADAGAECEQCERQIPCPCVGFGLPLTRRKIRVHRCSSVVGANINQFRLTIVLVTLFSHGPPLS
jgi:hypothetical protein